MSTLSGLPGKSGTLIDTKSSANADNKNDKINVQNQFSLQLTSRENVVSRQKAGRSPAWPGGA